MNEPCRLCGSEPTLATYYDFYVFHCPTPGCPYHLGGWKVANGKGKWYGSIDDAREAWNQRQRRGETPSAPETAEPEPKPTEAGSEPQDGVKHKTKKQLRADAAYRVLDCRYDTTADIVREMVNWGHEPHTGEELRHALIDLLTDDDSGTMETETSQVPEHDTREQLEAWAHEEIAEKWAQSDREVTMIMDDLRDLLGRQAAITEREVKERVDFSLIAQTANALFPDYQERIDELTAEVEAQRKRANDAERGVLSEEWYISRDRYDDDIAELTAERNDLLRIAKELEKRNGELLESRARWIDQAVSIYRRFYPGNEYAVPADVRRIVISKIDELTAERDELKAKLETYGKIPDQDEREELRPVESGETRKKLEAKARQMADTREKLERDIKAEYYMLADEELEPIFGWLERQAEITEREVLCQPDERDEQIAELTAERDQLKAERDKMEAEFDEREERIVGAWQNVMAKRENQLGESRQRIAELAAEREQYRDNMLAQSERVAELTEKCQAQREELARFNAEKRGKRRLPKHVAWPRHDDGKLVKLNGLDAKDIVFTRDSCLVRYNDGTDEFFAMGELRRRWKERK